MRSLHTFGLALLCPLLSLFLAGCGGDSSGGNSSPSSSQLTVTPPAAGTGTVTSTPVGINCPATCSASFPNNTRVTLTATPASNYFFSGWSGSCSGTGACSITLAASATVGAAFKPGFGLTVSLTGAGTGTVTSSPSGINCPTTCSAGFAQNTQVTLSESPGSNYVFAGWSGACTGSSSCSVTLSSSESVTATFGATLQGLNHIVIFLQENRSLDHYFGAMRQYWSKNSIADQPFDGLPQFNPTSGTILPLYAAPPTNPGCDPALSTATNCVASTSYTSNQVTSFHMASVCNEEQSPFWNEAHVDWDLNDPTGVNPPAFNGFVQASANDARQVSPPLNDVNGLRAMGYFDGDDLNYYYFMASNFATSDRWFSPVMSRTQLNRMYLLAATSAGHAYPLAPPYSALSNTTIFQELQNAGISWKIYVNPDGTNCSATDSSCLIGFSYINMFDYEQTILASPTLLQNIVPITQFTTDVQNGTLPQVALIEPASVAGLDEHPNNVDTSAPTNIQEGANYAAGLINAFMVSPNWSDSAMIFTYDEDGGYYDHVSPQPATPPDSPSSPTYVPIDLQPGDICDGSGQLGTGTCNFAHTGYRIPLIVISPFAKKNYVSHTVYDYTAALALIEKRFGVPALTNRDAAQADMSIDFFDFVNAPWATPPSPPTQIMSGQCTLAVPTL